MFCIVYRRYKEGSALATPQPGVFGRLYLEPDDIPNGFGRKFLFAHLTGDDKRPIIPVLWEAVVEKITDSAIVIRGAEKFGPHERMDHERRREQCWVCRIISDPKIKELDQSEWPLRPGRSTGKL